jgi:hypothetical protein
MAARTSPPRVPFFGRLALSFAAVSVGAVLVWPALRSVPASKAGPPFGQVWIGTQGTIGRIHNIQDSLAERFFDAPTSYGLGGGWQSSVPTESWASASAFIEDLDAGRIASATRAVMYDPEHWLATPVRERRDPVAAMAQFADAAREAGYAVVITPHPNLVDVPRATCGRAPDEAVEVAFLRCGIQAAAARVADVVEVQAQFLQENPSAYRALVERAAEQARAVNPDVIVLAGLSTRYAERGDVMLRAWDAVFGLVDGHYLAMPEGIRPLVAAEFLGLVSSRG